MKVIKIDLPSELKFIELHTFADEHISDEHCDMDRLRERIEYVKNTPNAYCILNGDIIDNATKTSVGDVYSQVFNPMEQLKRAVELFSPIEDKIICITPGNHERRTYKHEGIDLTALIAAQLGIADKYAPGMAYLFVRFGNEARHNRKLCYTILTEHGSGGGRSEGSKLNRLIAMASIADADIYIHSHTHIPIVTWLPIHRTNYGNSTLALVDRLFVNTAANLDYGGYGELGEFKPASKRSPVIYMNGTRKEFDARS